MTYLIPLKSISLPYPYMASARQALNRRSYYLRNVGSTCYYTRGERKVGLAYNVRIQVGLAYNVRIQVGLAYNVRIQVAWNVGKNVGSAWNVGKIVAWKVGHKVGSPWNLGNQVAWNVCLIVGSDWNSNGSALLDHKVGSDSMHVLSFSSSRDGKEVSERVLVNNEGSHNEGSQERVQALEDISNDLTEKGKSERPNREKANQLFWNEFYKSIPSIKKPLEKTEVNEYYSNIFDLLERKKNLIQSLENSNKNKEEYEKKKNDILYNLQKEIEEETMYLKEENLFKSSMTILNKLTNNGRMITKDILKGKIYERYNKKYPDYEVHLYQLLSNFGLYTLEAIIIHVLGSVFNCVKRSSAVRVSTLIDLLDRAVLEQAVILNNIKNLKMSNQEKRSKDSLIGTTLVEHLNNVGLISIENRNDIMNVDNSYLYNKRYKKNLFSVFQFEFNSLPIRLNLPMVSKPVNWEFPPRNRKNTKLADLRGGYLSGLTGELYSRFRALTSHDYEDFYIEVEKTSKLCPVLNKLQSQAFEINAQLLSYILSNRDMLEEAGLLMNRNLADINLKEGIDLLRSLFFSKKSEMLGVIDCSSLIEELLKRVQRARYECFILRLAEAYSGYSFYLPAFMDFRGRIYRAGLLHFHERDLAKSLILFSNDGNYTKDKEKELERRKDLACAAAFKYGKYKSYQEAHAWYMRMYSSLSRDNKYLIETTKEASAPFQFLARFLNLDKVSDSERIEYLNRVPVTQDASASAYQMMSYLLLNEELGVLTNLLPSNNEIHDIYMYLHSKLIDFLQKKLELNDDNIKLQIIKSGLTRKQVKGLYMPLIYGKTSYSMKLDISRNYGSSLSNEDKKKITELCNDFWKSEYPDISNIMNLFNLIGWFSSALGHPVIYSTDYYTTVQDYRRSERAKIWVYNRFKMKRHQVTLRVRSLKRDKRKSKTATCVNFIHQKDAIIAMKVVEKFMSRGPVYTVHDNFITTSYYANKLPIIYSEVFISLGFPHRVVMGFVLDNLRFLVSRTPLSGHQSEPNVRDDSDLTYREILEYLVPEGLREKDQIEWAEKISEIVSSIDSYLSIVKGSNPGSTTVSYSLSNEGLISEKWNQYKSRMLSITEDRYSLHY